MPDINYDIGHYCFLRPVNPLYRSHLHSCIAYVTVLLKGAEERQVICMFIKGIKTNIIINLAFLLMLGMLLLDLVFIFYTRKIMLQAVEQRCELITGFIEQNHNCNIPKPSPYIDQRIVSYLRGLTADPMISTIFLLTSDNSHILIGREVKELSQKLPQFAQSALNQNTLKTHYHGATWGILWKQHQYMISTRPISACGGQRAAVSIIISLDQYYSQIKQTQHFVLIYILANTIFLTLFGLYRLSKMTVRPLQSLVERAESYHDEGDDLFLTEEKGNEFSTLSKALNRMLHRISADRTELKQTVGALESANKELKRAQRDIIRAEKLASVGRLSAGIAHEIGNPIGIVVGYLELLKQEDLSSKDRNDCLERMESEINRINSIIHQLLDFSRSSSTDFETVSVHAILKELTEMFELQPLTSTISISFDHRAQNDIVFANPAQLRQVFLNILLNAADAIHSLSAPPSGTVNIRTRNAVVENPTQNKLGKTVQIVFTDTGPGIAVDHIDNVFDPFFTTKDPGKGTGLGLSVSFTMVERMGGTIEVCSYDGKGAQVTVTLPLYDNQERHDD